MLVQGQLMVGSILKLLCLNFGLDLVRDVIYLRESLYWRCKACTRFALVGIDEVHSKCGLSITFDDLMDQQYLLVVARCEVV